MKIIVSRLPKLGVALRDAPFGSVVTRPCNDVYYLVASPMDCSGDRVLVTLEAGILKRVSQDTRVVPVEAGLFVAGAT